MNHDSNLWRAAALAVLALAVSACSRGGAEQKPAAPPAVPVTAVEVAPQAVPVLFEAVGRTEGSKEVEVRSRVSGILEQKRFAEGDAVRKGAALYLIERAPFEIELQQASATLAQERARHERAQGEAERLKGLADRRAISQREADDAAAQLKQTAAAVELAAARVRQAQLNLSYTSVEAPIAGITGRAQRSVGSLVSAGGENSLLTTLVQTDPIWVRFALSEAEFARLRGLEANDPEVRIELADGRRHPVSGRLNFAGSTVDAALGTVQMRAELPNPKLALLPGQFVNVRVLAGTQQGFLVPQAAVMQGDQGRFVWTIDAEGKAAPRPVRTGEWMGKDWVVLEGLKAGDRVIVDNLVRLRPGALVQMKPPAAPAQKAG